VLVVDTNVQALKNLYVAYGGQLDDVEELATSADVINAIADLISSQKKEAEKSEEIPVA